MIWSSEERQDVEELMLERLGAIAPKGVTVSFTGETLKFQSRASMRFSGLRGGAVLTIEAAIDREAAGIGDEDAKYLLMDALDNLAFDWFESLEAGEEERLHGGWQKWDFQGHCLDVRLEKNFPELEAMADALIAGKSGD